MFLARSSSRTLPVGAAVRSVFSASRKGNTVLSGNFGELAVLAYFGMLQQIVNFKLLLDSSAPLALLVKGRWFEPQGTF